MNKEQIESAAVLADMNQLVELADKLDRLMAVADKLSHCIGCGCGAHGPSCGACYEVEAEFESLKRELGH